MLYIEQSTAILFFLFSPCSFLWQNQNVPWTCHNGLVFLLGVRIHKIVSASRSPLKLPMAVARAGPVVISPVHFLVLFDIGLKKSRLFVSRNYLFHCVRSAALAVFLEDTIISYSIKIVFLICIPISSLGGIEWDINRRVSLRERSMTLFH